MYSYSAVAAREDEETLLPLSPSPQHQRSAGRRFCSLPSLGEILARTLLFMRPSFMMRSAPVDGSEKMGSASAKKHSTEYLDGVRGVASLIVFILHWSHIPYPSINGGWGYQGNKSFWLLPFVRIIHCGAAMVSVFFVISGFVLSHRYIQRMHRREYNEMFVSLTSITWRRAIRLFLPAFVSSAMAFACACLGIIVIPKKVNGERFEHSFGAYLEFLDAESNPWDWTAEFFGFYNPQLWSIAVEYRGSMVVFLMVLALAKTRTAIRLAVQTFLIIHSFGHKRWDVALFVCGMTLAELQVLFRKPASGLRLKLVNGLLIVGLILGLFLAGYPRDGNTQTPGYKWSKNVWPYSAYRRRFWIAIGSILVVGPMIFLPSVQSIFMTRPIRYLGRISFSLYLVHGLGNRTVGKWLLHWCWGFFGKEGFWPYTISFVVSTSLYFPIIVWVSDMFWRAVDVPANEFARWLEKRCASPVEPER
ncbi:putative Acyltransferase 3 domain-containing protein [Seiridium cardinale]|uniref:Acyltransferase 3 domain-containing protein n=1 Tax=Seiridium cardinale TaxID=138064 RepID=A0ABR2X8F6_9PEZI